MDMCSKLWHSGSPLKASFDGKLQVRVEISVKMELRKQSYTELFCEFFPLEGGLILDKV